MLVCATVCVSKRERSYLFIACTHMASCSHVYLRICAFAYQVGTWCAHWYFYFTWEKKKIFLPSMCIPTPKNHILCFFFLLVCLFFAIKTLNQCQIQSSYINNPQRSLLNCIEFDIIQKTADILCQHSSFKGSHSPSTFS